MANKKRKKKFVKLRANLVTSFKSIIFKSFLFAFIPEGYSDDLFFIFISFDGFNKNSNHRKLNDFCQYRSLRLRLIIIRGNRKGVSPSSMCVKEKLRMLKARDGSVTPIFLNSISSRLVSFREKGWRRLEGMKAIN